MNKRIYVSTPLFSGWATITEYFPNEQIYPLQIVLDEPDAEGHAVKRICKADIVKEATE